jgi:hypothetical protein
LFSENTTRRLTRRRGGSTKTTIKAIIAEQSFRYALKEKSNKQQHIVAAEKECRVTKTTHSCS